MTKSKAKRGPEQGGIKSKEHSNAKNQATQAQRQVISSIVHSKHGAFKTFPSVFLLFLALPPKPSLVLQVRVQD